MRTHHVRALIELGRHEEALQQLAPLIAERPDDTELLVLGAEAELGREDHSQAVRLAHSALTGSPHDTAALNVLARALSAQGKHEEGMQVALRWVALSPGNPDAYVRLALTSVHAPGRGGHAEGYAEYARTLAPYAAATHFAVGYVAHIQGRRRDAMDAYKQALALDPTSTSARSNLARLSTRWRPLRAARVFASVLADEPQDEFARRSLRVVGQQALRRVALACVAVYIATVTLTTWTDVFWTHVIGAVAMALIAPALLVVLWRRLPSSVRAYARYGNRARFRLSLARVALTLFTAEVFMAGPATPSVPASDGPFTAALIAVPIGWCGYVVWRKRVERRDLWKSWEADTQRHRTR
jgi:Flp pilus assembly protein TadD